MIYCNTCGNKFDEDEIITVYESRGEFCRSIAYEPMGGCPRCRSTDIVEDEEEEEYDEEEEE